MSRFPSPFTVPSVFPEPLSIWRFIPENNRVLLARLTPVKVLCRPLSPPSSVLTRLVSELSSLSRELTRLASELSLLCSELTWPCSEASAPPRASTIGYCPSAHLPDFAGATSASPAPLPHNVYVLAATAE